MTIAQSRTAIKLAALAVCAAGIGPPMAQTIPTAISNKVYEVDVPGAKQWVETHIDLRGGAKLRFTAAGKITYPPDQSYGGKHERQEHLARLGLRVDGLT